MKSLLSLILCIAMLLGAAPNEAVPQTQTALTLRHIRVCANGECVEVAPEAKLTVALGTEQANAKLELIGDDEPIVLALQSEPSRLVLVPNSGRMFTAGSSKAVPALTEDSTETLLKLDAMQPFFEKLRAALEERESLEESENPEENPADENAEAETPEDVLEVLFNALAETEKAETLGNQVTVDDTVTIDGKTVTTELTLTAFLEMLDKIADGTGTTADLLTAGLASVVKEDGTVYETFADLTENDSEQLLPIEQIFARGEGVRYDRIEIKPEIEAGESKADENEASESEESAIIGGESAESETAEVENKKGEKGVCSIEITSWEDKGASVVFHLSLDGADEALAYDAQIDLEGTVKEPARISVKSDMTDTKTSEDETEQVDARHDNIVLTRENGLWKAAADLSFVHSATDEEPAETSVTIGYAESEQPVEIEEEVEAETAVDAETEEAEIGEEIEVVPPVIGATAVSVTSPETSYNMYFEIVREQEAFEDVLEPLAEMQLTESSQEIPAMVFGLDLEEMNAAIRTLMEIESIQKLAAALQIDLSKIVLPGEGVMPTVAPVPEETVAPTEEATEGPTPEATQAPTVVEPEIEQAIAEDEPLPEQTPQVDAGDPFGGTYPTV